MNKYRYCPLAKRDIDDGECFDMCTFAEHLAPARTIPEDIQPTEENRKICLECEHPPRISRMINLSTVQHEILLPLIPNLDDIIKSDDVKRMLSEIDWLIIDELDETQNFLSPKGIQLQRIYDQIY